jgi:hypothetical protein
MVKARQALVLFATVNAYKPPRLPCSDEDAGKWSTCARLIVLKIQGTGSRNEMVPERAGLPTSWDRINLLAATKSVEARQ